MLNNAEIIVPESGRCKGFKADGLSDDIAVSYARLFARLLDETDGYVVVRMSDKTVLTFSYDSFSDELRIGRLVYEYGGNIDESPTVWAFE